MDPTDQSSPRTTSVDANPAQHQVSVVEDTLYISPNKNINVSLVTQPLEGPENYIAWKKGMMRSLGFKKKSVLLMEESNVLKSLKTVMS